MAGMRNPYLVGSIFVLTGVVAAAGCYSTTLDNSELAGGPAPLRMRSPVKQTEACSYEDSLTGGQIFSMYCSYCHNAPALAERPFANFRNVAAHMRVRANLTGKEYAKVVEFLRRWHDVPPGHPPLPPEPKRMIFSQPISELRPKTPAAETAAKPQPQPAAPEELPAPASPPPRP